MKRRKYVDLYGRSALAIGDETGGWKLTFLTATKPYTRWFRSEAKMVSTLKALGGHWTEI